MDYNTTLTKVRRMREHGLLDAKFCWICLKSISHDLFTRKQYIQHKYKEVTKSSLSIPLEELFHHQYMRNGMKHWDDFIGRYLPVCDQIVICYTNVSASIDTFVCGVCLLIEGEWVEEDKQKFGHVNDVYVRCLCSNCYCGSVLLKCIISYYTKKRKRHRFDRITLHSEPLPQVLSFYSKHNFITLNKCIEGCDGLQYPFMVRMMRTQKKTVLRNGERQVQLHETTAMMKSLYKDIVYAYKKIEWYMA
jgi:hypothetical protein